MGKTHIIGVGLDLGGTYTGTFITSHPSDEVNPEIIRLPLPSLIVKNFLSHQSPELQYDTGSAHTRDSI